MSDWAAIFYGLYGLAIVIWGVVEILLIVLVIDGVIRRLRKGGRRHG